MRNGSDRAKAAEIMLQCNIKQLGPTGRSPEGKINMADEGEHQSDSQRRVAIGSGN
jgi:hypothetical protein